MTSSYFDNEIVYECSLEEDIQTILKRPVINDHGRFNNFDPFDEHKLGVQ